MKRKVFVFIYLAGKTQEVELNEVNREGCSCRFTMRGKTPQGNVTAKNSSWNRYVVVLEMLKN